MSEIGDIYAGYAKKRMVARWFVDGKGHSSAHNAARWLAKRELGRMVSKQIDELAPRVAVYDDFDDSPNTRKLYIIPAYAKLFPRCDEILLGGGVSLEGYKCCRPGDRVCWRKRKEWIAKRTAELKAIIEESAK